MQVILRSTLELVCCRVFAINCQCVPKIIAVVPASVTAVDYMLFLASPTGALHGAPGPVSPPVINFYRRRCSRSCGDGCCKSCTDWLLAFITGVMNIQKQIWNFDIGSLTACSELPISVVCEPMSKSTAAVRTTRSTPLFYVASPIVHFNYAKFAAEYLL